MGKNTLVINCDIGETRVALIENGILAELHVERKGSKGIVGNIYLGKVSRVLPGMQAAFIDIGEERAAFLHVEDLIRPADFEAYLAGGKGARDEGDIRSHRHAAGHEVAAKLNPDDLVEAIEPDEPDEIEALVDDQPDDVPAVAADLAPTSLPLVDEADEPDAPVLREVRVEGEVIVKVADKDEAGMAVRRGRRRGGRAGARRKAVDDDASAETAGPLPEGEEDPARTEGQTPLIASEGRIIAAPSAPSATKASGGVERHVINLGDDQDDMAEEVGFTIHDAPAHLVDGTAPEGETKGLSTAEGSAARRDGLRSDATARTTRERGRGERRGRDRRGRDVPAKTGAASQSSAVPDSVVRPGDRKSRDGGLRLQRSTPINEVVKEGQEVIVQVTKDPIGTKGARVSSHVSLPGRYVVYMPTVEHVGVSRRIGNDHERRRLREAIEAMKPPKGGLIVRTVAEGLTKKQLKADVGYLVRLWGEIARKKEEAHQRPSAKSAAPMLLFQELDVVLRTARDMFTDDVEKIVIDDREQYQRLLRFIEMFMPERASAIELYAGDEPIFDAYGLEDEIARALSRKVPLSSGGHLIIDQAEALTAIDVNSGRFVGKGNRDPEDTILQTNLEAVQEIAYQLRFRNIGGLIVLDLIDMEKHSNREKVYRALEQALMADKAKTSINRISELGLVEMTRKRTRESLGRTLHESCFYCDGTGQLQSRLTIAFEILRQIRRERRSLPGYKIVVNAHPSVVDLLQSEERDTVKEAERRYQRQIMLVPHREYHIEQFDLAGG